jgi:hypothetical protein
MPRLLFLLITFNCIIYSQFITQFEKSRGQKTGRLHEVYEFISNMATKHPAANMLDLGKSQQQRPLQALIIDKDGYVQARSIRSRGRLIVFIQACIHAGEVCGKDAGILLFRDLLEQGDRAGWLRHLSFVFLPVFNVDGHERFSPYNRINQNGPEAMGWRVTADNHNLNRDFSKADTPEMQAWLAFYHAWLPEFFFDIHSTNGADYQYPLTYALESHGNMSPQLSRWQLENFEKPLLEALQKREIPAIRYVYLRQRNDVSSGIVNWVAPPRFSQGYTALLNRPGILVETHMLKPYPQRVAVTRALLEESFTLLASQWQELSSAIKEADAAMMEAEFRQQRYPLKWRIRGDSIMISFKGIAQKDITSPLTGSIYPTYTGRAIDMRIPYFEQQEITAACRVPLAYVVPVEWREIISRLQMHGITMQTLPKEYRANVTSYAFSQVTFAQQPYEGRFRPQFSHTQKQREQLFAAGSVVIPTAQLRGKLAMHLLEPDGPDSFIAWGFFNAIFERKEYAEAYVMEPLARDMLSEDPQLAREFAKAKAENPAAFNDQRSILNWFYRRTPYYDERHNQYPIALIFDAPTFADLNEQLHPEQP